MSGVSLAGQPRATREDHIVRMHETERMLTVDGRSAGRVVATLRQAHGIGERQGWRYVRAVRAIYRRCEEEELLSPGEHLRLLLARSEDAIDQDKPDYSASVKALEVYARMRGWLDRRDTLTVRQSVTVQHIPALDGLSDETLAAIARVHELAARDRMLGSVDVVDSTASADASADASVASEPTRASVIDVVPANVERRDGR